MSEPAEHNVALQDLIDRTLIIENLARYHHAIDAKDWERLADLFSPDAAAEYRSLSDVEIFGLEGRYVGRQVIIDWIRAGQEPFQFGGAPTHFMMNHVVEVDGDAARSVSSFADIDLVTGLIIGSGIYTCDHSRRDGRWLLQTLLLEQRLSDAVVAVIAQQRADTHTPPSVS